MAVIEFVALAAMCAPNVDVTTLSAVVHQESRANVYAIGVNSDYTLPRQPQNLDEAIEMAQWLLDNGYNFDAGLGQINSANFEWLGMNIPDLFDPCKNLRGAATVLTDCYSRASERVGEGQEAIRAALSCYNTGNFSKGFRNGYVQKVAANVGVAIPALEPMKEREGRHPVQLQASRRGSRLVRPGSQDKPREGLTDAFGASDGDAFVTSDHLNDDHKESKTATNK